MLDREKELEKKYEDARKDAELYYSTMTLQSLYIEKLEKEVETLRAKNTIDPDALLSVKE